MHIGTRVALWRNRLLRFALGGGTLVVAGVFGAVRNKWLAEHLSTVGVGALAQVLSAQTWLATVAGLGLSLPVARAVAARSAAGDGAGLRRTVWTAGILVAAATLAVILACLQFAPWVSRALLGTDSHAVLVRISMLGVAGLALNVVAIGLFSGRSDVVSPLVLSVAGSAVATAFTIALVPGAGLAGGALGVATLAPAGLAAALWVSRRANLAALTPVPHPRFDPATARSLLGVGLATLVVGLIELGTPLAVRAHYLRMNGIPANGLLQAAVALSQYLSAIFQAYLVTYAFGRISASADPVRIRDYTRRQWMPLIALAAVAAATMMLLSAPLLRLFYSDRFVPAQPLMAWTVLAEFSRVATQTWILGALPLGAVRHWVAIGITGPAALALAYVAIAPVAGTLAVPYAAAIGALVQLAVAGMVMSRRGVSLRAADAGLLVVALVALALLARTIAGPA